MQGKNIYIYLVYPSYRQQFMWFRDATLKTRMLQLCKEKNFSQFSNVCFCKMLQYSIVWLWWLVSVVFILMIFAQVNTKEQINGTVTEMSALHTSARKGQRELRSAAWRQTLKMMSKFEVDKSIMHAAPGWRDTFRRQLKWVTSRTVTSSWRSASNFFLFFFLRFFSEFQIFFL